MRGEISGTATKPWRARLMSKPNDEERDFVPCHLGLIHHLTFVIPPPGPLPPDRPGRGRPSSLAFATRAFVRQASARASPLWSARAWPLSSPRVWRALGPLAETPPPESPPLAKRHPNLPVGLQPEAPKRTCANCRAGPASANSLALS